MPIKSIFFDMDNTLIDFFKFKEVSSKAAIVAMKKSGLKIDSKKAFRILWNLYFEHGFENREILQKFLEKVSGDQNNYKILAAGIMAYRKARMNAICTYPKVKCVLRQLAKKYLLVLVTDAPAVKAWIRLTSVGMQNKFSSVFTLTETGKRKSSGVPFTNAMKTLKLKPNEVLVVGDSMSHDIIPAKRLGMKTCLATYGRLKNQKSDITPDYRIRKITDVTKILM
jgi:putative hydrolase of the HAD superfamily